MDTEKSVIFAVTFPAGSAKHRPNIKGQIKDTRNQERDGQNIEVWPRLIKRFVLLFFPNIFSQITPNLHKYRNMHQVPIFSLASLRTNP